MSGKAMPATGSLWLAPDTVPEPGWRRVVFVDYFEGRETGSISGVSFWQQRQPDGSWIEAKGHGMKQRTNIRVDRFLANYTVLRAFNETVHGPMQWGTCVDCGDRTLVVGPTERVNGHGLKEDTGVAEPRCGTCGRAHHGASLDYYRTGRDELYGKVALDRHLDPTPDEDRLAPG